VHEEVDEPAEADIEEVSGGMRLMNAGIEAVDGQGKVYRVEVVEVMAAKGDAADGNGGGEKKRFEFASGDHIRCISNSSAICFPGLRAWCDCRDAVTYAGADPTKVVCRMWVQVRRSRLGVA
jgi:hypothetical protein